MVRQASAVNVRGKTGGAALQSNGAIFCGDTTWTLDYPLIRTTSRVPCGLGVFAASLMT
jgi:hypothetical protein